MTQSSDRPSGFESPSAHDPASSWRLPRMLAAGMTLYLVLFGLVPHRICAWMWTSRGLFGHWLVCADHGCLSIEISLGPQANSNPIPMVDEADLED